MWHKTTTAPDHTRLLIPMNRILFFLTLGLSTIASASAQNSDWTQISTGVTTDIIDMTMYQNSSNERWAVALGENGIYGSHELSDPLDWSFLTWGLSNGMRSIDFQDRGGYYILAGQQGHFYYRGSISGSKPLPDADQDYVVRPTDFIATGYDTETMAVGSNGSVYTLNDHENDDWVGHDSPTNNYLHDVARNSEGPRKVYAVGDGGTIIGTEGGDRRAWEIIPSGTTRNLCAIQYGNVHHDNTSKWLIVGEQGTVLRSDDDGQTWHSVDAGTSEDLLDVFWLFEPGRFLAVGTNGAAVETTNYGQTWCSHDTGTTQTLFTGRAVSLFDWFVAGEDGLVLYSSTQGGTCVPVANESPVPEPGYSLSQPWPNPAMESTSISLILDRAQHVTAKAYDQLGRQLATLYEGIVSAQHVTTLTLDAHRLPAGTYVIRVNGESFTESRTVTILE